MFGDKVGGGGSARLTGGSPDAGSMRNPNENNQSESISSAGTVVGV
jgi:hypothetical protein